jgi:23S rRNA (cytidine1920-2'-O)/16S rRNA (cytidine1409-2'-O)-methyltransferase
VRVRLDQLLVDRGLANDAKVAMAMILAGEVFVGEKKAATAGEMVDDDSQLRTAAKSRFVSRGGDKLASVAESLGLDFKGQTVLDVGASTGGFTDLALQGGASRVYSLDVGTNQLDYKLRQDRRVTVMERSDIRDLQSLPEPVDTIVMDLSFISLTKVVEGMERFLVPGGVIVAMAKPQFEASKDLADRYRGVIPEPERSQVLKELESWLAERFEILAKADSGLAGAQGNLERFYKLVPIYIRSD